MARRRERMSSSPTALPEAIWIPGQAAHRPSGVATGPDGSLYIADDQHGRIWWATFHGDQKTTGIEAAPAPGPVRDPCCDDNRDRRTSGRRASRCRVRGDGRRPAPADRRPGARRLCLGAQSKGRQLKSSAQTLKRSGICRYRSPQCGAISRNPRAADARWTSYLRSNKTRGL